MWQTTAARLGPGKTFELGYDQTTDEALANESMLHHNMQCMQYVCAYVYTTTRIYAYNCVYKYVNYAYVGLSNVNISLFVQKYYTTVCIIYIFIHTIVCVTIQFYTTARNSVY